MELVRIAIATWSDLRMVNKFFIILMYLIGVANLYFGNTVVGVLNLVILIQVWVIGDYERQVANWQKLADESISLSHELLAEKREWTKEQVSSTQKQWFTSVQ